MAADLIFSDAAGPPPPAGANSILCGVHEGPALPEAPDGRFDLLIAQTPGAPAPWVSVRSLETVQADLEAAVRARPLAASVLAQVMRSTLDLDFEAALVQESLAYSMLLAGPEFRAWRAATPVRHRSDDGERVRMEKRGGALLVTLARAAARNAVDALMRDALVEALEFALQDPDTPEVLLTGEGPSFCAGGDLDEFGTTADPVSAHLIRVSHSPARLLHQLGARGVARLHGACIGAGIETPAAAARVFAAEGAWFQLPEVSMGLIPGAGGTVTIPRRIGRQRALFMGLTGQRIDLPTALEWGLVDAQEPAS